MSTTHPRQVAELAPDRIAVRIIDSGESVSYGELVERADRAAQLFLKLGLDQGDTIAIFLENHIRYAELMWAAKNSGITYVCISRQASVDDAAYILENSGSRLLISSRQQLDIAQKIAAKIGDRLKYLMLDCESSPFESYETLLAGCPPTPLKNRLRGPSMLYSSGTTGRPKGVRTPLPDVPPEVPPQRFAMLLQQYDFGTDTVFMNPGPLYHAAPGRFMINVLRAGGTVLSMRKFDPKLCLQQIDQNQATHGLFVPTMFTRMLKLDASIRQGIDTSSLRYVIHTAAPCPIPLKEQMIDWLGPIICELYGGTEAVGHTFIDSPQWLQHKGSVGRPASNCRISIRDESGKPLPTGTPGLIHMNNGLRFEYHQDAEKTRGAIDDQGWCFIGDIGYLDEDGYLYLTDRHTHMIISGGVNIYPQESENILSMHPDVADVAVIGVPDPDFGEAVKAVVQPLAYPPESPEALAKDLIKACTDSLSAIKCPRSVDFVETLPRTETGKLLKREVRKQYWPEKGSGLV